MKVILNALPPARLDTPSAALSVLKAFLGHHHIQTRVIYWNLLLDRLLPPFERNTDETHLALLPYLYLIAGQCRDDIAQSKTNAVIKALLPWRDALNRNSDYFSGVGDRLAAAAKEQFADFDAADTLLFGIPCKYEQWIPGMILAPLIKAALPHAKIVLGGLRNRDQAEALMRLGDRFDFAVWGEGEYPLLALCRALENREKDFREVPRLLYRNQAGVQACGTETSDYLDLNSRLFPDYDDYFQYRDRTDHRALPAILPLESSRGCTWNACRFCVYADGYQNRKKGPSALKAELQFLLDKYPTSLFAFMDNDIVANDFPRLEKMLDELIDLRRSRNIQFIAEVIPKKFTPAIMQKLLRAGLARVHFGYEGLSDRLLKKMRKRNNFSDNLFFVKFAHKYKIKLPAANIICGIVGEEDADILESIDNLHFLRFYCDRHLFSHNPIPLRVAKHSAFYDMLQPEDRFQWDQNDVFDLLPAGLVAGIDRFSLFDFAGRPGRLWEHFAKINQFYYDHCYSYTLCVESDTVVYREFFDGDLLTAFALPLLDVRILQCTHDRIMDFKGLMENLGQAGENSADEGAVRAALGRLRTNHLIYCTPDGNAILAVLDMDQTEGTPSSGTAAGQPDR